MRKENARKAREIQARFEAARDAELGLAQKAEA